MSLRLGRVVPAEARGDAAGSPPFMSPPHREPLFHLQQIRPNYEATAIVTKVQNEGNDVGPTSSIGGDTDTYQDDFEDEFEDDRKQYQAAGEEDEKEEQVGKRRRQRKWETFEGEKLVTR